MNLPILNFEAARQAAGHSRPEVEFLVELERQARRSQRELLEQVLVEYHKSYPPQFDRRDVRFPSAFESWVDNQLLSYQKMPS